MDYKDVKKIVNKLIKNEDYVMSELEKMSNSEIIKLKANIRGKIVHCDKWMTILIPIIAIVISIVGILYSNKQNVLYFVLYAYLILSIFVAFLHMLSQMNKENYTKILSYIEDFEKLTKKNNNTDLTTGKIINRKTNKRVDKTMQNTNGNSKNHKSNFFSQKENKFILLMIVVLTIGFICDRMKIYFVCLDDISSLSLTIIQIQTTIGILIITVISLISGNMEESHYGISICHYYLNVKPQKLNFKRIIFIVLGLSLISVISYAFQLYSFILCIFIVTIISVLIAITNIYSAFSGRIDQYDEIEDYLEKQIELSNDSLEKLFIHFCDDWKRNILSQDELSYKKSCNFFEKFITEIWKRKDYHEIEILQNQSIEICLSCLNTYNPIIQYRGMDLIYKIYSISKDEVVNNLNFNFQNIKFHLFREVGEELIEVLNGIDNRCIERGDFDLYDFFYYILVFCVRMNELNNDSLEYNSEIRILKSLAKSIGGYIYVQRLNRHIIDEPYWINFFEIRETFTTAELDETKMKLYSKNLLEIYFAYFYGLIMNCEENMIIKSIFNRCLDQHIRFENIYQIVFFLSIYAYLYYLGYEESICQEEIKKCVQQILKNSDVKQEYENILEMLHEIFDNSKIKSDDIYNLLKELLQHYELYNSYQPFKYSIIESALLRFYIFVITSIADKLWDENIVLEWITMDEALGYLSREKAPYLKKTFQITYDALFNDEERNEDIGDKYYNLFANPLKKREKNKKIEEVNKIDDSFDQKKVKKEIEKNIKEVLNKEFKNIAYDNDKNGFEIDLVDNDIDTKDITGDILSEFEIKKLFIGEIVNYLKQYNYLEEKSRKEVILDNTGLIEYLKNMKYDFIFGRKSTINPIKYQNRAELDNYTKDYCTCFDYYEKNTFVALNSQNIKIIIHSIDVQIQPTKLKKKSFYDEENDIYIYPDGIDLEFTKENLEEYLLKKKKNLKIIANISIECTKEKIGTIFNSGK